MLLITSKYALNGINFIKLCPPRHYKNRNMFNLEKPRLKIPRKFVERRLSVGIYKVSNELDPRYLQTPPHPSCA